MGYFAHITGLSAYTDVVSGVTVEGYKATVDNVIVANQSFIDSGAVGDPKEWIETCYNGSFRNCYAGKGNIYESIRDIFYPTQPYPSWILKPTTRQGLDKDNNIVTLSGSLQWLPPVDEPLDGTPYEWNEAVKNWVPFVLPTSS